MLFIGFVGCAVGLAGCGLEPTEAFDRAAAKREAITFWGDQYQELVAQQGGRLFPVEGRTYGTALAVSGDTALVVDRDGVSAFRHIDSTWVFQGEGEPIGWCDELNGAAAAHGVAAISGELALFMGNRRPGRFGPCVYERSGNDWTYKQALELDSDDEVLNGGIAIEGDTAMMASSLGIAVFQRTGGLFSHTQSLTTSDGVAEPKVFALSDGRLVALSEGSAYAFARGTTLAVRVTE